VIIFLLVYFGLIIEPLQDNYRRKNTKFQHGENKINFLCELCERILINVTTCQNETSS
jgi:hypothetical protein